MKILAIRGCNLASLEGEFAVDFRQEPLASTGLFSITGPTGAGKSTLLDALCLALYNNTPRLIQAEAGRQFKDPSGEELSFQDGRHLLRRGSGKGYAQVEFMGNDQRLYRAHWEVRRARERPWGRLQSIQHTLLDLTHQQPLEDQTRAVVKRVEALTGLSFTQFTRSVLLAQNEFSAFLKADEGERAKLLEVMTDTAIFSRLSMLAFQRAKAENERLQALEMQWESLPTLTADARQQLEANRAEANRALTQVGQWIRWHEEALRLEAQEQSCQQAWHSARHHRSAAEPRARTLQYLERLQPTRPLLEALEQSRQLSQTAQAQLLQAQEAHQRAQTLEQAAHQAMQAAHQQVQQALTTQTATQAALQQARALDATLQTLAPLHANTHAQLRLAQEKGSRTRKALHAKEAEQTRTSQRLEELRRWQKEHPWQVLTDEWSRWEGLLQQAEAIRRELKPLPPPCPLDVVQQALLQAEQTLARCLEAKERFDTEAQAQARQRLEQEQEGWRTRYEVWQQWSSRLAALEQHRAQQAELEQSRQTQTEALARGQAEYPRLEGERHQAELMLHLARQATAQDALAWRERLLPDQPCPVCGAPEHPYVVGVPPQSEAVRLLEGAFKAVQQRWEAHLRGVSASEQALADINRRWCLWEERLAQLQQEEAQQAARWEALPPQPSLAQCPMAQRQEAIHGHLTQLRQQLQEIEAQEQAQRKAQKGWEAARHQQEQLRLHERLERLLLELAPIFAEPNGREAWQQAPQRFVQTRQEEVRQWHAAHQDGVATERRALTLAAEVQGLQASQEEAQLRQAEAEEAYERIHTQWLALRSQRQGVLGGRAAAEVERELAQALERAQQQETQQRLALHTAQGEGIRTRTELAQAQRGEQERAAQAQQAQGRLEQAYLGLGVTEAALREMLETPKGWLEQERAALQALDEACTEAVIRHEAQVERCVQHLLALPRGEERLELEALRQRGEALVAEAAQWLEQLARDGVYREQQERLGQEVARQRQACDRWNPLNALIGAADGKKFRLFAQQFALDLLVELANGHLAGLSRRYGLRRIAGTLSLMVVDRLMGDEERTVHSLSGGESFLVSLGLALGLASLSSDRVQVESLFIDEGFGSLDAEALQMALDALECLPGMGRKVGVISHVPEMVERMEVQIQIQPDRGTGRSKVRVVSKGCY